MLFVIENWQKSISEAGSNKEGPTGLPEAFKEQVAGQIDSVLTREHSVYKLMCKFSIVRYCKYLQLLKNISSINPYCNLVSRALDFLRSTLSARPPNPIQLPTGFGCLSESASSSSSMSQTSVSMDPSVCAFERPSMTRIMKQDMSSSSDSNFEHFPDDLSRVYDLALIASRLMPLVAHNRHVFGPHYAEIIQCLLKPAHPTQSSE